MLLLDSPELRFPKRLGVKNNFLIHDTKTNTRVKLCFNLLKNKRICFIREISPYRAANTFQHGYKIQSVNDV
jgi:hypothetical protein